MLSYLSAKNKQSIPCSYKIGLKSSPKNQKNTFKPHKFLTKGPSKL